MKRTKYPIHPDFWLWTHMNPPLNRAALPAMQFSLRLLYWLERSDSQESVRRISIPTGDGEAIRALLYSPKEIGKGAPCLIYYHGGGFVWPAAPYHYRLAREYARKTPCHVLFVNYRLAPQYPFPTAPEDCYAAYMWLLEHVQALGIDIHRVAVGGDSAGGQLATVVCLMARDRLKDIPCGQMLLYPAAGNVDTPSQRKYTDTPMCNARDMAKYEQYYRPDKSVGQNEYASPIEAEHLEGLPSAYVETAEFDCLRDGGILYAQRLKKAGTATELYNTSGTMHGFDIVLKSPIVRECVSRRIAFLQTIFNLRKGSA